MMTDLSGVLVGLVGLLALASLNKLLVDYFTAPCKKKWPGVDWWFLLYVAGVTGFLMGWASTLNLFSELLPNMAVVWGRVLTSLLVGAGSSVIHDWLDTKLEHNGG